MGQEKLLWQLQGLVQEEYMLRKKEELKPLIGHLKALMDNIKQTEEHNEKMKEQRLQNEKKALQTENEINSLNTRIKGAKDKLYGKKGGSLKELLSLQQSVLKMGEEAEKNETAYLELLKNIEELKEKEDRLKEVIRALKKEYNENVRIYQKKSKELELELAQNELRQEEIREQLDPDVLRLFQEVKKRFPKTR